MKTKRISKKGREVLQRMEQEFPAICKKFPFKWKQDLAVGFALGAGLDFEEAWAVRAEAVDNDFWE